MRATTLLAAAGAATLASAGPIRVAERDLVPRQGMHFLQAAEAQSKGEVSMYWGQNKTQWDLGKYCTEDSGVDIILLAFLHGWGNGQWSGVFGTGCEIVNGTIGTGCADLGTQLGQCNSNGKQVYLSVGGNAGNQKLNDEADAKHVAESIFRQFAKKSDISNLSPSDPRPFGDAYVNGFDFNYEQSDQSTITNLPILVNHLRDQFGSASYKLSAAPMCGLPSGTMGSIIANAAFDHVWPQFYNGPGAAWYYTHGTADQAKNFNYVDWVHEIQGGASKNAQVWFGLPGGPYGATMGADGPNQWLPPSELSKLVGDFKESVPGVWGGVMLYDAAQSQDATRMDGMGGKTYAEQATCVVKNGGVC